MAKRRRLDITPDSTPARAPETKSITRLSGAPPIADIAGQAAAISAAEGAVAEIAAAREDGRLVIRVPLDAIDLDHLIRDRMLSNDEDMAALKASIASHGQRTPIELVDMGDGRYGLISGWRRLAALTALAAETGDATYSHALAILRRPDDAGAAYVAMVEENEIRVGLSYYERARIAAMAAERGAFANALAAIDVLYAAGSKAKRSKIRGFLLIHEVLGEALRFPAHLPERLGLRLVKAIREGRTLDLLAALKQPAGTPEEEAVVLEEAMRRGTRPKSVPHTLPDVGPGISLKAAGAGKSRSLTLCGAGVTADFEARLKAFLRGEPPA